MMLFEHNDPVTLTDPGHRYFAESGTEYLSWSKFFKQFEEEFDAQGASMGVARKEKRSQQEVLAEWDATRENSIKRGNYIHDNLEAYRKTGEVLNPEDPQIVALARSIGRLYAKYRHQHYEQCVWDPESRVAGTSDIVMGLGREKRMKAKDQWIDWFDYKTNISKGIRKFSTYYQNYKYPISHLPDCEYNKYALQLSGYAYMAEKTWGYRPRQLAIIYIPENMMKWHLIPVNYMKHEVEAMFQHFTQKGGYDAFAVQSKAGSESSNGARGSQADEDTSQGFF